MLDMIFYSPFDTISCIVPNLSCRGPILCFYLIVQKHQVLILNDLKKILIKVLERLNKYGFSLGPSSKYTIKDNIGSHFLYLAVQLVKEKKRFVLVLDNVDWDVKAHDMRSKKQNRSVHAVRTSIVFDRVNSDDLPDNGPKTCLAKCNMEELLKLSDEEQLCTRER